MVKKGYKQTEVGVIPEDWECVKIKDVATISMCKRIFANQTSTIGDVPFYKIGTFGKEADAYISSKLYVEYRNKYSFPQKGDILISAAGTLGRTVVYDGEKAYFQDSNIVWLDINKTRLCNEYLNQYYKVIKWASSEGSTIARLYNGIIYATYISLPPLPEQQRIAEALSDVDGMISSLEKLVAKYKSIKTACLQQMFPQNGETVPRMRLPGFTGAWEQRKYGEVVETRRGLTYKPSDICDSGIRVLRSSNIDEDTFVLKADDVFVKKDAVNIDYSKENDILITSANGSSRLVGKHAIISSISGNPAVHGGFMLLGTTKEPYFINASMGSSWYRRFIELYVAGGNGAIGNLNKNDLDNQVILIPSEPEQRAIGAFFKQLDHLITLHQRKLDKAKKIKQGMMQQLLTGKIRLV